MYEGGNSDESSLDSLSEHGENKSLDDRSISFGVDTEYLYEREVKVNSMEDRHRYDIYFYHKWILIKRPNVTTDLNLWIDRETCECKECYGSPASPGECPIIRECAYAILGVLRISLSTYLVIVTQETFVTTINLPGRHKISVYMIASAVCLAISPMGVGAVDEYIVPSPGAIKKSIGTATNWISQHFKLGLDRDSTGSEDYRSEIKRQILLVERLLENGFYYSINEDLGVKFQDLYTHETYKFNSCTTASSNLYNTSKCNVNHDTGSAADTDDELFDFMKNCNKNVPENNDPYKNDNNNKSDTASSRLDSNAASDVKFQKKLFEKHCKCVWSSSGNDSFKWNLNMGIGFPCCWLTSVIQGYYASQTTLTPQGELTLILIGRRSIYKPGTRITCRGIDDKGHVANFVETELAVILPNGHLSSVVMCRGSVPIFWEQTGVMSSPNVTHCVEMLKRPFLTHFSELCSQYGDILCVNLLNDRWELCLTEAYSNVLQCVNRRFLLNQFGGGDAINDKSSERVNLFDLPESTSNSNTGIGIGTNNKFGVDVNNLESDGMNDGQKNSPVEELQCLISYPFTGDLSECSISLINYNFASNVNIFNNAVDLIEYITTMLVTFMDDHQQLMVDNKGKVLTKQKGCIRVNCLDCLDRTNAFQWCYGWVWLIRILESIPLTGYTNTDITINDARNASRPLKLPEIYKVFWSEYGDAISLFYAGTASTYSSYILQGSNNISVAFNVARTYIERIRSHMLEDQQRSEAMELILAKHQHKEIVTKCMEDVILSEHADDESASLKIWCGTWNIAGMRMQECDDLQDWLNYGTPRCDIYAFFIQELVELTTFRVLTNWTDPTKEHMLEERFKSVLKGFRISYLKIRSISLLGLCLVIYVKSSLVDSITNVDVSSIKTGLNGNYGNKGAVAVRMRLNSHNLSFVNVHLPPGRSNSNERLEQMDFIIHNIFQDNKPAYRLLDRDLVFIGGDFNFRLQIPHDDILKYLCKLNLSTLLEHDEFVNHKKNGVSPFNFMNEQEITFQPSYKFKKNSPFYDLRRSPAWCDRILFFSPIKQQITPLSYKRHERYCSSDHKPISAIFQVA
ncbi:inositol-1,4,5-trisphosphate 5-phosphatase [Babesia microti strain RI]|uniref:phosphoinositide 5-phosphatase n=1 Tax=Babesia microti (strain RI) TaxID=1133968 RepID=A0A1R4ABH0_BABMR|nr:inositol-1,4,5-trisphosphate 5-phosphatase [Babesia microti strain RI]SJK86373.1 inositol-1,4,5-trisphosphate 5-phosphatase [Babesia microti strain RI]|eukprot:XP_021338535.1 inositol-1,4,5-trisphosphate 5-phosphatase [Babesia microti strain RI]